MADDPELDEFRKWKREQEKTQVFSLLDEWAEKSGLKKFLDTLDDEADDDDGDESLGDAAATAAAGGRARKPKAAAKIEAAPAPPQSFASRLFGSGDAA